MRFGHERPRDLFLADGKEGEIGSDWGLIAFMARTWKVLLHIEGRNGDSSDGSGDTCAEMMPVNQGQTGV